MVHIDFTSSWPVLTLAILLMAFLVYWSLESARNSYYSKPIKIVLIILRVAAMAIFAVLLSDLRIETSRHKLVQRDIAFLWDLSRSVSLADSSYDAKDILNSKPYKELETGINIEHIYGMKDPGIISENRLKQLPANEPISDDARLLRFAEKQMKYDELVLVSDGRSYLGEDIETIELAPGLNVHAIGIGEKRTDMLPVIRSLKYPAMVFSDDSLSMDWFLYNPGSIDLSGVLTVKRDGEATFSQAVKVPAGRMIPMQETFSPSAPGIHKWEFVLNNEGINENLASENIIVHDNKVGVVCSDDPLDRDIAMISTVLNENEQYHIYDLKEWISLFGSERPDLVIQTWQSEKSPRLFNDVPTVLLYRDDSNTYRYESGLLINEQRPYVDFTEDYAENSLYWTQLPPIQVANFKAAGDLVLKSADGRPVIMEDHTNKSIIINAAGLWKWNLAGFEKDWDGIYAHLINGIVKTLLWQFNDTYIALDEDVYMGMEYETLPVAVRLSDQLNKNDIVINVTFFDSAYTEINRRELKSNNPVATFSFENEGTYYVSANLLINGTLMGQDTARILINKNNMELRDPGLDENALRRLAQNHNGNYIHLKDISALTDMISTDKKWEELSGLFIARKNYVLYVLMFLLLCADWIIRKRSGGI